MVIAGPTAAGKSALALELAREFGGEIVNGDSVQIYRGMDLGTAKPGAEERLRVPHHLFDVRNPDEVFTAGEYCRVGREAIREIAGRGRLPIVVGGSGFYLRALLEGLAPLPVRSEPVRERLVRLEARSAGALHRILRCWDAEAAARIHGNDTQKLVRAIEAMVLGKDSLTKLQNGPIQKLDGFRVLILGLDPPRDALRERIAQRTRSMFERGLLAEVEQLQRQGYGRSTKAMEAVGYRQAHAVLAGEIDRYAAEQDTTLRTRQYAKRQMTWFRKTKDIHWLSGFGEEAGVQARAKSLLKQNLSGLIEKSC